MREYLAMIAGVVVMGTTTPALAGDYIIYFVNNAQLAIVDRDTVRWREGRPQVTTHTVWASPLPAGDGQYVQRVEEVVELDCEGRRLRIASASFQDLSGIAVIQGSEGDEAWQLVEPNSAFSDVLNLVCLNQMPEGRNSYPELRLLVDVYLRQVANWNREAG